MIKTCFCGKEFETNKPNQVNCSVRCRNIKKSRKYASTHKSEHKCICVVCGVEFLGWRSNTKTCSPKCCGLSKRKYLNIPQCLSESDRKIDKNIGYVRVYCPMHPKANTWGYVYEHRLIAEKMLGRYLTEDEVVHHKDSLRWNNTEENLVVMNKLEHARLPRVV